MIVFKRGNQAYRSINGIVKGTYRQVSCKTCLAPTDLVLVSWGIHGGQFQVIFIFHPLCFYLGCPTWNFSTSTCLARSRDGDGNCGDDFGDDDDDDRDDDDVFATGGSDDDEAYDEDDIDNDSDDDGDEEEDGINT